MFIPPPTIMSTKCIEETGKKLMLNNEDIVKYICNIEEERENLEIIIQRQYQERKKIEAEIEKLTYKLCLINKSLSMRIKAKNNYDRTIEEIRNHYKQLVDSSNTLRNIVEKQQQELDGIMNKKIGTGAGGGEEIKMLYLKANEKTSPSDDCTCIINELPTKDGVTQPDRFIPPPSSTGPKTTAAPAPAPSQEEAFVFPEEHASISESEDDKQPLPPTTTIQESVPPSPVPSIGQADNLMQGNGATGASGVADEPVSRTESEEDDEIEVNTVNAENARYVSTKSSDEIPSYQPSIDTEILGDTDTPSFTASSSTKGSIEKSGPLPEVPKGEDRSTGVLIERLKLSMIEAEKDKDRTYSRIDIPTVPPKHKK